MLGKNKAARLGAERFGWWQDWRGECVAIIASGPSAKNANLNLLRDRIHVIAIKENVNLCPWADVVYGCDGAWWIHRKGLPEYRGIKLSQDPRACASFGLPHIKVMTADKILLDEPATVGSGGNSGFQALNLAVQFGATGIILVGFDMQGRSGTHWYGRNGWNMANNPTDDNYRRWCKAFTGVAGDLAESGIDVINASPSSALTCFRKTSIEAALAGWGL